MSELYPARIKQVSPRTNAKHVAILKASIKALVTRKWSIQIRDLTIVHKGQFGNSYSLRLLVANYDPDTAYIAGGWWEAYVPHHGAYNISMQWVAKPQLGDSPTGEYKPQHLPAALFAATPEAEGMDDPFNGAADFFPVRS